MKAKETTPENEKIVRVSSNKNIFSSLETDICNALEGIKYSKNKYHRLFDENQSINQFEFYELDINSFLNSFVVWCKENEIWDCLDTQVIEILLRGKETEFNSFNKNSPIDLLLKGCIEGLVAALVPECSKTNSGMWSPAPDGIDGWFYNYFLGIIDKAK